MSIFARHLDDARFHSERGGTLYGRVLSGEGPHTVDLDTGCWLWDAARNRGGYGRLRVVDADGNARTVQAHRFYYEVYVGPIPTGLHIDHLCRTPRCVNPEHLEPVTNRENVLRGKKTRLTEEIAAAIRASSDPYSELAARYDIAKCTVINIRAGRRWEGPAVPPKECVCAFPGCEQVFPGIRGRRYCSKRHQQAAWVLRQRANS